ncbi:MAG: hypothetical protein AAF690_14285 [Acidobacteriota bacterium]
MTVALFVALLVQGRDLTNETSPRGIVSLELRADDPKLATRIVQRWRCEDDLASFDRRGGRAPCARQKGGLASVARWQVYLDFPFIAAYGVFFFLAAVFLKKNLEALASAPAVSDRLKKFALCFVWFTPFFAAAFPVAAVLDLVENVFLLRFLETLREPDGNFAEEAAWWKFFFLKLGLVHLLIGLLVRLRFAQERRQILQLLFLARVPLLSLVLLVALPVLCYTMPTMLRNLLVVEPGQLLFLTTLTGWLSGTVLFTLRNVLLYGAVRFGLKGETVDGASRHLQTWFWLYAFGLAVPLTLTAFWLSGPSWMAGLSIFLGVGLVLFGYAVVAVASSWFDRDETAEEVLFGGWFAWVLSGLKKKTRSKVPETGGGSPVPEVHPGSKWAWIQRAQKPHADLLTKSNASEDLEQPLGGYFNASDEVLIGHIQNALFFGLSFLVYVVSYFALHPALGDPSILPTLGYVLGLLIVLTWALAGAAFYLDRYRVPLLLVVILVPTLMNVLGESDHYFKTVPSRGGVDVHAGFAARLGGSEGEGVAGARTAEVDKAVGALSDAGKAPVVVVAASGGGITAAVWTTAVLTSLERTVPHFRESVHLLSTVSGGSAGALHYIEGIRGATAAEEGVLLPHGEANEVITRAGATSLNAAAWGLAYPDLLRGFLPVIVLKPELLSGNARYFVPDKEIDRGWALEYSWRQTMSGDVKEPDEALLEDWGDDVLAGKIPPVVFNTTEVETGSHFVFSPLQICGWERYGTVGHYRSMAQRDVRAATAARLSATFPWVTPIARPTTYKGAGSHAHFADGGFYDNFGVVSALHWIDTVLADGSLVSLPGDAPQQLKDQRLEEIREMQACRALGREYSSGRAVALDGRPIILILIRASKAERIRADPPLRDGNAQRGWRYATLGPLQALAKVRSSTQKARNLKELDLLECAIVADPDCDPRSASSSERPLPPLTVVDFELEREAPLTWKLTDDEWCRIVGGWNDRKNQDSLETVRRLFLRDDTELESAERLPFARDGRLCSDVQVLP